MYSQSGYTILLLYKGVISVYAIQEKLQRCEPSLKIVLLIVRIQIAGN